MMHEHPAKSTRMNSLYVGGQRDITSKDENDLTFDDLPPFPEDIPTAPILRINLQKLIRHDGTEIERLWQASCDIGFFHLDLRDGTVRNPTSIPGTDQTSDRGIDNGELLSDVGGLFRLAENLFALPTDEKQKYDQNARRSIFGYKGLKAGVVDSNGTLDRNETYNVSKDDIFGHCQQLPSPALLKDSVNRSLLARYMRSCHAIASTILSILNGKLGLPLSTLENIHRQHKPSGDQVTWVHSPPSEQAQEDQGAVALGEHTDYGSLTVLFNRLGGLQIRLADQQWYHVRPLRGHAVCNIGDALVKFSAGILHSNIHRVVAPPGAQARLHRYSLVYFTRPEDDVVLAPLQGQLAIIDNQVRVKGIHLEDGDKVTSKEWIERRVRGRRAGGDYENSRGTEFAR